MQAVDVAQEYFRRMQARDPKVIDLFTEDAQLVGLGNRVVGKPAIAEFYAFAQQQAAARPEVLLVLAKGSRVIAEAKIHLADGTVMHAVDRFDIEGDRIATLLYFTADYPPAEG